MTAPEAGGPARPSLRRGDILVLTGSHRGAATRVGQGIAARLAAAGTPARAIAMADADAALIAPAPALVICTATFGSGGVPPGAAGLLEAIRTGTLPLAGKPVGIVGLGDSSFRDTYNGGCRLFAAALGAAGARSIAPLLLFDAAAPHLAPDVAGWTETFLRALAGSAAADAPTG